MSDTPRKRALTGVQRSLLRLIFRSLGPDGWASVSAPVFTLVKDIPKALVTLEQVGFSGRGRISLTDEGKSVINAMAWLGMKP